MECPLAAAALLALHPTPAQRLRRWPSTPPAPHFAIHVCLEPGPAVTKHRVRFALLEHGVEQPVLPPQLHAFNVKLVVTVKKSSAALPSRVVQHARSDNFSRRVVNKRAKSAHPALTARWLVLPRGAPVCSALPVLTMT